MVRWDRKVINPGVYWAVHATTRDRHILKCTLDENNCMSAISLTNRSLDGEWKNVELRKFSHFKLIEDVGMPPKLVDLRLDAGEVGALIWAMKGYIDKATAPEFNFDFHNELLKKLEETIGLD